MAKARIFNFSSASLSGEQDLSPVVFSAPVNTGLIHELIKSQLGNKRQGNSSSKTRGEVRGTTKKPWAQKKTGRARAGSVKSPLWRGGGITFGPRPRDYSTLLPKKMRRGALAGLLSHLAGEGRVAIFKDIALAEYKTAIVKNAFLPIVAGLFGNEKDLKKSNYSQRRTVFVLSGRGSGEAYYEKLRKSVQNLAWVIPVHVDSLEMKDIFYARQVVFTDVAMEELVARFTKTASGVKVGETI